MSNRVASILPHKRGVVWSVGSETSVNEAIRLMAEKDIGFLPIITDGQLRGVLSERDIARKVVMDNRSANQTAVAEIMSKNVIVTSTADTLEEAMLLMSEHHIRHLPVVEGDKIVGVISMGDVVRAILGSRQETISFLAELALD